MRSAGAAMCEFVPRTGGDFGFIVIFDFFFFFVLDFGLSRLTSSQFIQYHVAGFYKPTIPQSTPSHLRDYSTCNNARLEFSTIFVPSFDPNELCLKNGLHSGGLNPGPLGHESSALTTRPWLLPRRADLRGSLQTSQNSVAISGENVARSVCFKFELLLYTINCFLGTHSN